MCCVLELTAMEGNVFCVHSISGNGTLSHFYKTAFDIMLSHIDIKMNISLVYIYIYISIHPHTHTHNNNNNNNNNTHT